MKVVEFMVQAPSRRNPKAAYKVTMRLRSMDDPNVREGRGRRARESVGCRSAGAARRVTLARIHRIVFITPHRLAVKVLTIGVDLASQPDRTAACQVRWRHGIAEVGMPETGVDDARVLELTRLADKLGIDVPLGWPQAFVAAVTAHHEGRTWTGGDQRGVRFRETDRVVYQETKRWPLSVSTDRIAVPAMRAAGLLGTLSLGGTPVDRAGRGKVVEVYPAAALRQWGLPASGYKGKDGLDNRRKLVEGLRRRALWLCPSPSVLARCEADDNALDALVAALVARAAACGLCEPIPPEAMVLAEREGWIALPRSDSLERLAEAEAT